MAASRRFFSIKTLVNTFVRYKHTIDYSHVPELNEKDLEEMSVRGSGPGGQAVAKTANKAVLKHIPTGITVYCHETRSLDQNRKKARLLLITKLDNLINKENSVEAQMKRIQDQKSAKAKSKREKLLQMKLEWKKREGFD